MLGDKFVKQFNGCSKPKRPCLQPINRTFGYEACKYCSSNAKNVKMVTNVLEADDTGFLAVVVYQGGWADVLFKSKSIGTIRNGELILKRVGSDMDSKVLERLLSYETLSDD